LQIFELAPEAVFDKLGGSPQGISAEEAQKRLAEYGPNAIKEVSKTPLIYKFLAQFYHLMAIFLWIAGILAIVSDQAPIGYAIFGVIIINALFSFWQEFQAEKAVEELKKLLPAKAKVLREGSPKKILAEELVPGDLILLDEGDNISADGRLIEAFELRTNNSTLTGESEPVRKTADAFLDTDISYTEAPNLVFAGTSVAFGSGRALVVKTGMETEFGKIASLTQGVKAELSPLQKDLNKLIRIIAIIASASGLLLYLVARFGVGFENSFILAVGLIVANIPEGLLPSVTLGLAIGVKRLVEKNALVKKLSSVETLGSTDVICTDKTGTLTQNEMTVRELFTCEGNVEVRGVGYEPKGDFLKDGVPLDVSSNQLVKLLLKAGSLCNDAKVVPPEAENAKWKILGDPTEAALLVSAAKAGFDYNQEFIELPRIHELPFDSVRKMMSSIHDERGQVVSYIKGAPKELLDKCTKILTSKGVRELTAKDREKIVAQNDDYARAALRVLAMAYRELPNELTDYQVETVEKDLTFIGLQAMMDPPRPAVTKAIEECHTAGIKIIMITGDYGLTAESIARNIGMVKGKDVQIITGIELDKFSDKELKKALLAEEIIFARVAPEHKMRVVSTLKDMDKVVAVTGDGVNDAPALKRADIGVAMGITGTDVAKEASEMVITDDNFASIVHAIEEGRIVYDNLRKFISYIFCHLTPEILPFILWIILAPKYGFPLAISIMVVLAIDLGTDTFPALALATEAAEPGIMQRPPRSRKEPILNAKLLSRAYLFIGMVEAVCVMAVVLYTLFAGGYRFSASALSFFQFDAAGMATRNVLLFKQIQTIAFVGLAMCQIGSMFANRTMRVSVFKIGIFSNKWVNMALLFELIFIPALVLAPFVSNFFGLTTPTLSQFLFVLPFPFIVFFAEEIRKFFVRKYRPVPGV